MVLPQPKTKGLELPAEGEGGTTPDSGGASASTSTWKGAPTGQHPHGVDNYKEIVDNDEQVYSSIGVRPEQLTTDPAPVDDDSANDAVTIEGGRAV